jgi:hypothetical protein
VLLRGEAENDDGRWIEEFIHDEPPVVMYLM